MSAKPLLLPLLLLALLAAKAQGARGAGVASASDRPASSARASDYYIAAPSDDSLFQFTATEADQPTAAPAAENPAAAEKPAVAAGPKPGPVLVANDKIHVIVGGAAVADFLYNHARPLAPGTPFFLTPGSPTGLNQDTFDAHARETNIYALFTGPDICGWKVGGFILANFYNTALVVDEYGFLPIQAFGELRDEDWRFAAGLQLDIFNPLNPTVLPFSLLGASGNTGAFRGQARIERFLHPSSDEQWTLTAGISDPVPTSINNQFDLNEDNGFPDVEARVAVALGALEGEGLLAARPFEWGISAVGGQMRTTTPDGRVLADVWGLGTDVRWKINECWGMKAEFYTGETLGTYMGGILQNTNSATFKGIQSTGGWGEVYYYIWPQTLHTHWGYGIDDPLNQSLAPGQALRNDTIFANLIWDVTQNYRAAIELTYRRTDYLALPDNEGAGVHVQFQWKF